MKFFSKDWHTGRLPNDDADSMPARYKLHIANISVHLPIEVTRLISSFSLHDGLLQFFKIHASKNLIQMGLLCGDKISGYYNLTISYSGVSFRESIIAGVDEVAENSETEIISDEWDGHKDSLICHRLLFSNWQEISFFFKEIKFQVIDVPTRKLVRAGIVVERLP